METEIINKTTILRYKNHHLRNDEKLKNLDLVETCAKTPLCLDILKLINSRNINEIKSIFIK